MHSLPSVAIPSEKSSSSSAKSAQSLPPDFTNQRNAPNVFPWIQKNVLLGQPQSAMTDAYQMNEICSGGGQRERKVPLEVALKALGKTPHSSGGNGPTSEVSSERCSFSNPFVPKPQDQVPLSSAIAQCLVEKPSIRLSESPIHQKGRNLAWEIDIGDGDAVAAKRRQCPLKVKGWIFVHLEVLIMV